MIDTEAILECVLNCFTLIVVQQLHQPISKQELHQALLQMAKA